MASSNRNSIDHAPEDDFPTSTPQSLSKAVHARRSEYTRSQKIKVKIGSWNVAACPGTERDLGAWFVQGKGVDEQLSGVKIVDASDEFDIESVEAQEARRNKKESTVPKGDVGAVPGGEEIGLYVLGLQEVVDLTSTREYIGKIYNDPAPMAKWRRAASEALPEGYTLIAEQQLSGLLLLIFASPAIAPTISSVSTVSVGTGLMGYLGNKGAVTTRIVLGETTRMVFINSHLASGNEPQHLERRIWDVQQVLQRTRFEPISWAGVLDDTHEAIGEEDFAFWFGDLNFRLDGLPGDDIRRLLMLHTKGIYDVGNKSRNKIEGELGDADGPIIIHSVESDDESEEDEPRTSSSFEQGGDDSSVSLPDPDDFVQDPSQDPASLQTTLNSLLPHDQLKGVMKKKKAFHDGWREGPITFLPTYKYDVGSMGVFDSSEKKRAPSWCDRILFRTRRDKLEYDGKSQEEELARIKDEEMKARGIDHAGDEEEVLFDYNPDEDGVDESTTNKEYDEYDEDEIEQPEAVITKEGYVDRIHLNMYTSHQRVLSSDHKPLDAVFTLEYDAVIPELKSKIQAEVAKELDRAENEGRPGITVVVDHPQETDGTAQVDVSSHQQTPTTSGGGVDFGGVSYQRKRVRSLTIANTSQVPATLAFVDRPGVEGEGDRIAPPWLSIQFAGFDTDEDQQAARASPRALILQPGETVNATLTALVNDITQVRSLNEGTTKLEDILVLRVTDGRDHFIPVYATWLQSCFARSVDELIRIPEGGVRALMPRPKGEKGGPVNRGQEVCWSAPRELFKLTEAVETLSERVIADSNMLSDSSLPIDFPAWPFDSHSWTLQDVKTRQEYKEYVLEALDADKNLNESFPPEIPLLQRLEIMSEVLLAFLNSLTDGIVPASLWDKIEAEISSRSATKQHDDNEEIKTWVLDILATSPNHNVSFVFLTSMLARVAGELAPLPKASHSRLPQVRKSLETVRRSLSWKTSNKAAGPEDPAVVRRREVERAFVEVWRDVVFRAANMEVMKEKEKRALEERRSYVLGPFLGGPKDS